MKDNLRRRLNDKDKEEIGLKCCNCGTLEDLEYHHIIPISLGGNDINSNMCCMCVDCHNKVHVRNRKNNSMISHSELTKKGLEEAKKNGKHIGRAEGQKVITKKEIKNKELIIKYSKRFNGTLNDIEVMKLTGLARNTYYKYKKEIVENM